MGGATRGGGSEHTSLLTIAPVNCPNCSCVRGQGHVCQLLEAPI